MILPFDFKVRRSKRAKTLRIQVGVAGVQVIVPDALPERSILPFLHQHQAWVMRKLQEFSVKSASCMHRDIIQPLVQGASIPFGDEVLTLKLEQRQGHGVTIRRHAHELHARIGLSQNMELAEPLIQEALFRWVKTALGPKLETIMAHHSAREQLEPRFLRIKRMRTRWGSCGPMNDINLNWLLAFCPLGVLEYVVVHELCHIRHRNHSALFWELVDRHLPDWQQQRQWLKDYGPALIRRFEYG